MFGHGGFGPSEEQIVTIVLSIITIIACIIIYKKWNVISMAIATAIAQICSSILFLIIVLLIIVILIRVLIGRRYYW